MKTISTNFKNILKRGQQRPCYVIKLTGMLKASPYTERIFYLSDQERFITDTTEFYCYPIIQNDIEITEQLNVKEHTASIGGFSIQLMNVDFSDFFNTYYFYNRDIEIYYGDMGLTDLDDFEKRYSGIVGDISENAGIIDIPVTNSTFKVQKTVPEKLIKNKAITASLSREVLPDAVGKPYGFVYGDYDQEATSVFAPSKEILATTRLMYVGDTARYWAVCENKLKSFADAWYQDNQLGRKVQVAHSTYPYYGSGSYGSYITTYNTVGVFTYWNNNGSISKSGIDIWGGSEDNLIDDDESTFASPNGTTSIGTLLFSTLVVNFDSVDNYDGENLTQTVYAKVDFGTNNPALWTFKINGVNAESSTGSYSEYGTTTGNVTIELANVSGSTQTPNNTLKIYVCVKKLSYDVIDMDEMFISCKGKPANTTLANKFTDLSTDALIENPAHVVADLIVNVLGITEIDSSFQAQSAGELNGWKFAHDRKESIDSKDLIDEMSINCKSITRWNENNEPSLITFKDNYTADITLNGSDFMSLPNVYKSNIEDVVNKSKLQYQKITGYRQEIEQEDNRTGIGSQAVYNAIYDKQYQSDYITDTTTAEYLADYWCKDDNVSFWSEVHHMIDFELPIKMKHNFYAGDYIPYTSLGLGDVVKFTNMLVNCNGETWKDRKFLIISKGSYKNKIVFTGFEVYDIEEIGEFHDAEFDDTEFNTD